MRGVALDRRLLTRLRVVVRALATLAREGRTMIRSATTSVVESRDIHDLPMADFLRAIRWGDNVRPVNAVTKWEILDAYHDATRVGLRERRRSGRAAHELPRIDKREIVSLSDRVLRILCNVAAGMSDKEATAPEGVVRGARRVSGPFWNRWEAARCAADVDGSEVRRVACV